MVVFCTKRIADGNEVQKEYQRKALVIPHPRTASERVKTIDKPIASIKKVAVAYKKPLPT